MSSIRRTLLWVMLLVLPAQVHAELKIHRDVTPAALQSELETAWRAYRDGELEMAWTHYRAAERLSAENRDVALGLAAVALQEGRDAQAEGYLQRLLRRDPRDALAQAALCDLQQDRDPAAESRLELLLVSQPDQPILYYALGNLRARQSRWGEAARDYAHALRLAVTVPQYAYNLAIAEEHAGDRQHAMRHYQTALLLDHAGAAGFDHALIERRIRELTEQEP